MTQEQSDKYYIKVAQLCANNSYALKLKVGAVIVKDNQIISDGFNGTPCGFENRCETKNINGELKTLPYVLHAESNAILKCAKYGRSTNGATLYITHSPCIECAKLIIQAGIVRVVYLDVYRTIDGIVILRKSGINVEKIEI